MTAFFALIQKDLRLFFLDRRAVIMSFVAPILIGSFFGYVFGGDPRANDPGRMTVLVVDLDRSPVSRSVLQRLASDPTLAVQEMPLEDARQLVRRGKAPVAVVFPERFSDLAGKALFIPGERPALTFFYDPSHRMELSMVKGMLAGYVMEAVSQETFTQDRYSGFLPPALAAELKGLQEKLNKSSGGGQAGMRIPFDAKEEELTARRGIPYNPYAHSFGGMAIQFILFMGIDVGIGMLMDRQRGLWKRYAAAPLSRWTLLGSRMISATMIAVLVLATVFTFAHFAFGVRIDGSLPGFMAVCVAFGLMTSSYGLLIAALGKTPAAARGLSVLATLLMVMLSGAWIPSFLFPAWLQEATKLVPARWAMDGLDGMSWRGLGVEEAGFPVLALLVFSAIFVSIAVMRFRWESDS